MPARLPEPAYLAEAAVRRVRSNGAIKWQGGEIYVSATLAGEPVAVEETGDRALRFYAHPLGYLDLKHMRLVRAPCNPHPPTMPARPTQGEELLPIHRLDNPSFTKKIVLRHRRGQEIARAPRARSPRSNDLD